MWIDDQVLEGSSDDLCLKTFLPHSPLVVLGRSNKQQTEVNRQRCDQDGVLVTKRLGGGGTVILHPGCLVVSAGLWVKDYYKNDLYFRLLNQSIIYVIEARIPAHSFSQRGYSDIVLGEKKLAGTSLFRSRNYLLYQASLLIDARIDLMETYLQHPSAEPDYRKGRSHRDFVMGLNELVSDSPREWLELFQNQLKPRLLKRFEGEGIPSDPSQVPHLLKRIGEAKELD